MSSAGFALSLIISSIFLPIPFAADPICVSSICPTFILEGTPRGFKTISTGFPFSSYGISSTGMISEITPLFPCLPAILSPGWILLLIAKKTLTILITPGAKSWPLVIFATFSSYLALISLIYCLYEVSVSSITVLIESSLVLREKISFSLKDSSFSAERTSPFFTPFPLTAFLDFNSSHSLVLVACSTTPASSSASFFDWSRWSCSIAWVLSSFSTPSLVKTSTPITVPFELDLCDVSFTSDAFSPKIALNNFSSGESWVSPLGVIFPTKMSPGSTSAPTYTIPHSSSLFNEPSPTFGISAVISSEPSFVSLAIQTISWIWIDVNLSSLATFSEIKIESSKLYPFQGIKAILIFCPNANSPLSTEGPSARISSFLTTSPAFTIGRWLIQVFWFDLVYLIRL